jgi:hypothetical protein
MKKKLVFLQRGKTGDTRGLEEALRGQGFDLETIVLSEGEPLPKSLENIDGLLVMGSDLNVYEQSSAPLTVY